ncbi:MAG: LysM peptidoglycan-binding domain-containing protein, partial [Myxococcaceae bacterium]
KGDRVPVSPGATLLLLCLAAADGGPAAQVVVQQGESLEKVAKRALGDEKASAELRALNGLSPDAGSSLPPGTALKLPGPDRALALSALVAARNAVSQADSTAASREQGAARLAEAEAHFQAARYAQAAQAADGAWQLVSARAHEPTRFAVAVDPEGRTKVTSQSGKAVRVEGEGVAQQLYAGQEVKVEKGKPPPLPEPSREAPEPVAPLHEASLKQTEGGKPAPISLEWSPVAGAKGYVVEIAAAKSGKTLRLKAATAKTVLPSLPAGRYRWTVKTAYPKSAFSGASKARTFELLDEPLRLEVGKTTWK